MDQQVSGACMLVGCMAPRSPAIEDEASASIHDGSMQPGTSPPYKQGGWVNTRVTHRLPHVRVTIDHPPR